MRKPFCVSGRVFWLPLLRAQPEERDGERRFVLKEKSKGTPSLRFSPPSFLTGREGQEHAGVKMIIAKIEMRRTGRTCDCQNM